MGVKRYLSVEPLTFLVLTSCTCVVVFLYFIGLFWSVCFAYFECIFVCFTVFIFYSILIPLFGKCTITLLLIIISIISFAL